MGANVELRKGGKRQGWQGLEPPPPGTGRKENLPAGTSPASLINGRHWNVRECWRVRHTTTDWGNLPNQVSLPCVEKIQ